MASGAGQDPPAAVSWAVVGAAVLAAVLLVRRIGLRRPGRLAYWAAATGSYLAVPLAWVAVLATADEPEHAGFYVTVALSPFGWIWLVPLLLIGAVWSAVLARMSS